MMAKVEEKFQIFINYSNPDEHVPGAERNNRFIKEWVRTAYHRLPYSKLPKVMISFLAMQVVHTTNYFPAKNGLSKFYSPCMKLNERRVNFKKQCACEFGTYVETSHETTNTNAP